MAYFTTDKCLGERYAQCVQVCPVDCIKPGTHRGQVFMVILPDRCTDCGLCLPQCPVGAIIESGGESSEWIAINAALAPEFESHPDVPERPRNDPPRKPGNVIVNP